MALFFLLFPETVGRPFDGFAIQRLNYLRCSWLLGVKRLSLHPDPPCNGVATLPRPTEGKRSLADKNVDEPGIQSAITH